MSHLVVALERERARRPGAPGICAALHGAWDTAVLEHPITHPDVPSYTDARGFATFAMTGLALAIFGWLILRGTEIPRVVGQLAIVAATLLLIVYFGRLIVLNPKRPLIKWVAVVSGLVVNPAFYLAYARSLLTVERRGTARPSHEADALTVPTGHGVRGFVVDDAIAPNP